MGEGERERERERKVTMATRGFPMAAEREERGGREKKKSGFGVLLISERKPNKMKKNHSECLFFFFTFLFFSIPSFDTNTHTHISIHKVSIIYLAQYNRAYI
jgi:hypothetical protein